ncbi:hypothetical protein POM88_016247 [Heracleum sosnowskyi]|uniref:Uncharacterized protein n=1 Tax=Heracleum sosnowskyi TaxID=360622 RepID=A0AAD8MWY8_9APIA|nr:hypothetical protein POM88_016247 [Heracleum sosnowskyi]
MNINAEKTKKLKDMNDEKEMINNTRKKLQFSNVDDGTPGEELIGLSEYLKRFESPRPETKTSGGETKTAAGEKSGKNAEGQGCNDYEIKRNDNIAKNKAKLKELGLVRDEAAKSCQNEKGKYKVTNDNASESEYFPNNDDGEAERQSDHGDDNVTSKRTKKVKRQRVEIGAGPRTRSRATKLPDSSQMKEPDEGASLQVNKAPVVSLKEKLNNLRNGPGSMTAYLALREQEKVDSQKEIPRVESEMQHLQSQSVEKPVDEAPKRKRGKTKMNQEIAKKNSEARQKITETHTTGSTSFAQVAHMLEKLGKMPVNDDGEGEGNGEEDPIKVSDADIYLATRKRDEKREYKLPEQVLKMVNDKIVDVKKTLETEVSYEDDNDVNTD